MNTLQHTRATHREQTLKHKIELTATELGLEYELADARAGRYKWLTPLLVSRRDLGQKQADLDRWCAELELISQNREQTYPHP